MTEFNVGDILVNDLGQFTKIISIKRGLYGLSGWTNKTNAEKASKAFTFLNSHGLKYANARIANQVKTKVEETAPVETTKVKKTAKKVAKKKTAKKVD